MLVSVATGCWAYAAGPLPGALIAVGSVPILRGCGGVDSVARTAASGSLGPATKSPD
jgi:hypothetical protein